MYEDLCFDVCPQHTYPWDKLAADQEDVEGDTSTGPGPVNPYSRPTTDHPPPLSNSIDDKQDPLQAEDRRRRRRSQTTGSPLIQLAETPSRICATCDRSCLACHGPLASQCSTCSPGSQLRKILNETFCYAYVVRSTGMATVVDISEEGNPSTLKYMTGTTVLLLLALVFTLVGLTVAGGIVFYHRRTTARNNELYSRVALMAEDDSDSDNDDELFRAHFPASKKDVVEYRDEAPSEAISTKE